MCAQAERVRKAWPSRLAGECVGSVCFLCTGGGGGLICRLVELQPNSSLIPVKVIPGQPQEANCVSARSDQTQVLHAAGGTRVDAAAAADAEH